MPARFPTVTTAATLAIFTLAAPLRAQDHPHPPADAPAHALAHTDDPLPGPRHTPAEMNRHFADPALDVQEFVRRFEGDDRDVAVRRDAIVAALAPQPGEAVADVGAGTGLFTRMIADRVGAGGTVFAVEISPAFLAHIAAEAEKAGAAAATTTPVLGTDHSTHLPAASVDAVLLCATYHHFEHPRAMLDSIHRALRPGGRLVLVEWDLKPDSSPHVRDRARGDRAQIHRELADAGFALVAEHDDVGLTDNFLAVYRRADAPDPAAAP